MRYIPKSSFYFVRHGETDWNHKHIIMGSKDIPLNENGETQAEHAAYVLADVEIGRIFSSTLKRASKTAKIIADICELEIEEMSELCERGGGSLEGKSKSDQTELNLSPLSDQNLPKDGESYEVFEKRILFGLKKILSSRYAYPLIVSHSGVFAILANSLADRQELLCKNCQIFLFNPSILHKDKWEILPLEL